MDSALLLWDCLTPKKVPLYIQPVPRLCIMQSTTPGAATRNLTWVMSSASLRIRQVGIRDEDAESEQGFLAFQLSYWSKSSPKTHQASGVLAKFNAEGKEGPFLDLCVYLEWDWEEKYSLGQQVHKAFHKIPHVSSLTVVQYKSPYVLPMWHGLVEGAHILWVNNWLHSRCWQ